MPFAWAAVAAGVVAATAGSSPADGKPVAATAASQHVSVRGSLSEVDVSPGSKISIVFDVTPKARMHVYAPGGKYEPVTVQIEPHELLKAGDVNYPAAQTYFFAPLNEHALVYSEPFQLAVDVKVGDTADQLAKVRARSTLTMEGALQYQACDDRTCYVPASLRLVWKLKIRR